ncbi:type II toxin-antitoxin system prevent-host-death family antitoxin [Sphingomonas lenta]|uniref:Type II toxin-antitoxin system prevent-host-death family antitoxin n=1 Tax=Sphingomonas lenta TaxID=1141887 RepID=A0A2A2SKP3_9SPHN|nr:type II toxin-antitoxin system prevent-host-death family antitoxin [Sphingomonas lenta]
MHVNIGEAKTRLSELVAAAMRGEEVVLSKAGAPQVRLAPVRELSEAQRDAIVRRRLNTLGIWKGKVSDDDAMLAPSMTDQEVEERWNRKFGPAA